MYQKVKNYNCLTVFVRPIRHTLSRRFIGVIQWKVLVYQVRRGWGFITKRLKFLVFPSYRLWWRFPKSYVKRKVIWLSFIRGLTYTIRSLPFKTSRFSFCQPSTRDFKRRSRVFPENLPDTGMLRWSTRRVTGRLLDRRGRSYKSRTIRDTDVERSWKGHNK